MMICLNCGNTKTFEKRERFTCYGTTYYDVDGETEEELLETDEDFGVKEIDDAEYVCAECNSDCDVEMELDAVNILEHQVEHTRKDGSWDRNELNDEEQDEELKKRLTLVAL